MTSNSLFFSGIILNFAVSGSLFLSSAQANLLEIYPNTEGFSTRPAQLSAAGLEVWNATVRFKKSQRICADSGIVQTETSHGTGTGVIVHYQSSSNKVIIVTNSHVINGNCTGIRPTLNVGFLKAPDQEDHASTDKVEVLLDLPRFDLAFVRVPVPKKIQFTVARLANSVPAIGTEVFAVGYPALYLRKSWVGSEPKNKGDSLRRYSRGYLRAVNKVYPMAVQFKPDQPRTYSKIPALIHTADILPGNSGGPLFSPFGEVVGINTSISPGGVAHKGEPSPANTKREYCSAKGNFTGTVNGESVTVSCYAMAISSPFILEQLDLLKNKLKIQ